MTGLAKAESREYKMTMVTHIHDLNLQEAEAGGLLFQRERKKVKWIGSLVCVMPGRAHRKLFLCVYLGPSMAACAGRVWLRLWHWV